MLYGFQFVCTILCGLVPVCGSAILWRSSRSPQGFGASLPVAWSHPTVAGIKLFTHCSQQSYPCSWTYYHEDRAILVLEYISTYHVVIRAIVVTVGFVITTYLPLVYHLLLFSSITYFCFAVSYSPLKSHTKNLQPFIGTDYLVLFALILLLASHHRYSSTVLLLIFPTHPPHILSCVCWKKRKKERNQKERVEKSEKKEVERGYFVDCLAASSEFRIWKFVVLVTATFTIFEWLTHLNFQYQSLPWTATYSNVLSSRKIWNRTSHLVILSIA